MSLAIRIMMDEDILRLMSAAVRVVVVVGRLPARAGQGLTHGTSCSATPTDQSSQLKRCTKPKHFAKGGLLCLPS